MTCCGPGGLSEPLAQYTPSHNYPAVYAGAELIAVLAVDGIMRSAVAGVGREVSNGELGFLMSVTQKHLAMPSSPRIRPTLSPRSSRFFIAPRRTQGAGF